MNDVHETRRQAAWWALLGQAPEAAGFLVTSLVNIRYLTGFSGSNAALLLQPSGALLCTDGRYVIQAGEQCPDLRLIVDRASASALCRVWGATAVGPLAIESDPVSVAALRGLQGMLAEVALEVSGVVEGCRAIKDDHEIAQIERACSISDLALHDILASVHVGDSERQIARRLEAAMYHRGADEVSFATIIAAGPHSAKPHHEPTDRPIERGDLLLMDFGAAVSGYHADMTRTFVVGEPTGWQREIHGVVAHAHRAGCAAAQAGTPLAEVDGAARSVVAEAGFATSFDHGLGHGVGLQIHEAPFLNPRSEGRLPAGSTVTIEPGIYLPGRGGVRIEDIVVVSEGRSRPLTSSGRDLMVLG